MNTAENQRFFPVELSPFESAFEHGADVGAGATELSGNVRFHECSETLCDIADSAVSRADPDGIERAVPSLACVLGAIHPREQGGIEKAGSFDVVVVDGETRAEL